MPSSLSPKTSLITTLTIILIAFLPISLLLVSRHYYLDWYNSLWIIKYYQQYFLQYHSFPLVINTNQVIGIAYPIFYGYLLFPILGIISSIFGLVKSIFILAFFCHLSLCLLLFLFFFRQTKKIFYSLSVTAISTWSIYLLTNLYNRSAIQEYFGLLFLSISIASIINFFQSRTNYKKLIFIAIFTVFSSLFINSHPITALYGGICLCLFTFIAFIYYPQKTNNIIFLLCSLSIIVLISSPWLYAIFSFQKNLSINSYFPFIQHIKGIDKLTIRLLPFPIDMRTLKDGINNVSTPHLDAQINIPLFLLAFIHLLFIKKKTKTFFVSLIFFLLSILFLLFSTDYQWVRSFSKTLVNIQFAYRFVAYIDLFLLLSLSFSLSTLTIKKNLLYVYIILVTLSSQSLIIKLIHGYSIRYIYSSIEIDKLQPTILPGFFYGLHAYNITNGLKPIIAKDTTIFNTTPNKLDTIDSISLQTNKPKTFATNVYAFPWNKITDNNQLIADYGFSHTKETNYQKFLLTIDLTPDNHQLKYSFQPHPTFLLLKKLSFTALLITIVFTPLLLSIKLIRFLSKKY